LHWKGISAHIGSQIVSLDPFRRAFRRIAGHVSELRQAGIRLEYLDLGGGLGVRYTTEKTSSFDRSVCIFCWSLGARSSLLRAYC
jgi:diaminopimelate decarboxylase